MNTDIEWLFEAVYKKQRESPDSTLYFLSDWDCDVYTDIKFKILLEDSYSDAQSHSFNYLFAYEQFDLKQQIIDFFKTSYQLSIPENCLTISPSATQAIYLGLKALKNLNIKRYLIFTPAYFSTFESLKENNGFIYYYHLVDKDGFAINFSMLEQVIKEQFIECIVLTDPVFSAGLEFPDDDYDRIITLVVRYDLYLFIDYSLGGLKWNFNELSVLNNKKVGKLIKTAKFIFVDSLSKRLQLNGIKFSLILGDANIVDEIDTISEGIYGGLNHIQISILRKLYTQENSPTILDMHKVQLGKIKANYRLIQSMLIGENFHLPKSNSGYFTIISHDSKSFNDINTKEIILNLLQNEQIIAIPNNHFSYYSDNKFGWRINLTKNQDELLIALQKCIRKIFGGLNH